MKDSTAAVKRDVELVLVAYEKILSAKHGRRVPAQRTRNMIRNRGAIGAVERLVSKKKPATGYTVLAERGESDLTFEAVVLRHRKHFSERAVSRASARLASTQS